jgi:DNA repair protein RecN (Recombination protein N)
VITGETGAGKSILINGISLFLKKTIPKELIRHQSGKMTIQALFDTGREEVSLKREVENRERAKSISYINGSMVPFEQLCEKAAKLLNIYSQNQHIYLLEWKNQLEFLDLFAGNQALLRDLVSAYREYQDHQRKLEDLRGRIRDVNEKINFINYQIEEIDDLRMEADEDREIEQKLKVLSSSEEILSRSTQAINRLYHDEHSVYAVIHEVLQDIESLKAIFPDLQSLYGETEQFYNSIPDIVRTLTDITQNTEFSEEELDRLEGKMNRLQNLKRKYGLNLNQLLKKKEDLIGEKQFLVNIDQSIEEASARVSESRKRYLDINQQLRQQRHKAARSLRELIEGELKKLEMGKARFEIRITPPEDEAANMGSTGTDRVEFYFSSNPGIPLGPLKEVASGGELSRLMLVLTSIVWKQANATFIFDEIDTGIGGKTAEFVGEKLKKISGNNQVLCISHLPQIAVFADAHYVVSKSFRDNQTFTRVKEVADQERTAEIAGLMAGEKVDDDLLKVAEKMIRDRQS